jgi:uncharacterized protein (TIGR03437 family)
VQVLVNDVAAPLIAVRPGQINLQIPAETSVGTAPVRITLDGATIATGLTMVTAAAPGLFVGDPLDAGRPAAAIVDGRTVQIYGTGQGLASAGAPRVYLGAELAPVSFSGPQPSFPGLWQINLEAPDSMVGQVPLFVAIGGTVSNGVTVRLGN